MPRIFTNVEYADMLCVYGFCDGSGTTVVEVYRRRFPVPRLFFKVFNIFTWFRQWRIKVGAKENIARQISETVRNRTHVHTFFFRMADAMTSQNTDLSSRDTCICNSLHPLPHILSEVQIFSSACCFQIRTSDLFSSLTARNHAENQ
jgi:hypothetical protein